MSEAKIPGGARDGAPLLDGAEHKAMGAELHGDWRVEPGPDRLERTAAVQDFAAALRLVNGIGAAAEEENHHPDLAITGYRNVSISLSTHDAGGLTANDYVLARRFDALLDSL